MMLVCAGMIGVGKSTLTGILAEHFGTQAFYEEVEDNPILDKFYEDPKKYAFLLQIYFLNNRFGSIKSALKHNNNVLDRSIYEDALFTYVNYIQGNISLEELDTYLSTLDNMMEELKGMPKKAPDLLIYLDAEFDTILDHIKKRGRDYEQVEDNPELLDYYRLLWRKYKGWYEDYGYSPKMKIKVEDYDPNDEESVAKVIKRIEDKLAEVREDEQEEDLINHPSHYTQNGVETIDVIQASTGSKGYQSYLAGNIIKYLDRCEYKGNKEQDLRKAQWYAKRLVKKNWLFNLFGINNNLVAGCCIDEDVIEYLIDGRFDDALDSWKDNRKWIIDDFIGKKGK